jgi:subtilisin family serine protease
MTTIPGPVAAAAAGESIEIGGAVGSIGERIREPQVHVHDEELVADPIPMVVVDLALDGTRNAEALRNDLISQGVEVLASTSRRVRARVREDHPLYADPRAINGVAYGSIGDEATLHNDRCRDLLGAGIVQQGVDGLDGDGEIVAVLDTGVDVTHTDFAGRIKATFTPGVPGDATDRRGHGTHVAGTILGDGAGSSGLYRGIAWKAQLVVQASADLSGTLTGLPVTIGDRLDEAYLAGARVHNNSWGLLTTFAEYSADCWDIDEFVWKHRDMVVVFSAGNDANDRGTTFVMGTGFTVTAPGTAKNVITVGASRSDRTSGGHATDLWGDLYSSQVSLPPITDETISGDADRLAAFSGRGPCTDRRIKPDVVAIGTDVCSTKSSSAPDARFWGLPPEPGYAYLGGTSMAAPAVAGCCTLIRQWYRKAHNWQPSAALVKATLVNGARWLTGPDAAVSQNDPPNNEQGFGRVDLRTTIPNSTNPALKLAFADTWKTPARQFRSANRAMTWEIDVAEGLPLRICLTYTDAPGRGVQNDLNLYVEQPDSAVKLLSNVDAPNRSAHGLDKDNAVEIVRVSSPAPGTWRLRIMCGSLTRRDIAQDYALVVTGALTSELRFRP